MLKMNFSRVLGTGTVLPVSWRAMLLISKTGLPEDLHPVTLQCAMIAKNEVTAIFGIVRGMWIRSTLQSQAPKQSGRQEGGKLCHNAQQITASFLLKHCPLSGTKHLLKRAEALAVLSHRKHAVPWHGSIVSCSLIPSMAISTQAAHF